MYFAGRSAKLTLCCTPTCYVRSLYMSHKADVYSTIEPRQIDQVLLDRTNGLIDDVELLD